MNVGNISANAGHDVALSNSRGPEPLRRLADELGPNIRPLTVEEAPGFGEVVLVAIPFRGYETLPDNQLVEAFDTRGARRSCDKV